MAMQMQLKVLFGRKSLIRSISLQAIFIVVPV